MPPISYLLSLPAVNVGVPDTTVAVPFSTVPPKARSKLISESTALSSLSTSYYTEAHDSNATMLSTVTAEKLTTLAPGYTYTVNGTTITMTSEKDGYVFTATITDTLTISSFTSNKD